MEEWNIGILGYAQSSLSVRFCELNTTSFQQAGMMLLFCREAVQKVILQIHKFGELLFEKSVSFIFNLKLVFNFF
jgi:hypothetical protein